MPRKQEKHEAEVSELYSGRVLVKFYPEAKRNRYVVTVDGQDTKPSSVTQISGCFDKSQQLMSWAVNESLAIVQDQILPGMTYSEEELAKILETAKKRSHKLKQEAAEIGTLAHAWVERYYRGEEPHLPDKDAPHRPCVDAWLSFAEAHHVRFLYNERAVYSLEHKVSGRLDGIAEVDGSLDLIDLKTGNGIYPDMSFQTGAYNSFIEEELDIKLNRRWLIRLGKYDGRFHQHVSSRDTLARDFGAFLGLKAAYEASKDISKQLREDAKKEKETSEDWLVGLET